MKYFGTYDIMAVCYFKPWVDYIMTQFEKNHNNNQILAIDDELVA